MAIANLAVRFAAEILGVPLFFYWGLSVPSDPLGGVLLGLAAAAAFVVLWGVALAPRSSSRLSWREKLVGGTAVLVVAAGAVAAAGQPGIAVAYGAVVVVNAAVLAILGERRLAQAVPGVKRR